MNEEPSNKMMIFHHVCNRSLTHFFGKSNIELSFLSAGDKGKKIEFSIAHIDYEFFLFCVSFATKRSFISIQSNSICVEVRFIFSSFYSLSLLLLSHTSFGLPMKITTHNIEFNEMPFEFSFFPFSFFVL